MDLKDLFIAGGVFMWPLLISLLLGLAVAIERFVTYGRAQQNVAKLLEQLGGYIRKGDLQGAEDLCDRTRGPVAAILRAGLLRRDKGLEDVEKAIERSGQHRDGLPREGPGGASRSVSQHRPLMLGFPRERFSGMITGAFGEISRGDRTSSPALSPAVSRKALISTTTRYRLHHCHSIQKIGQQLLHRQDRTGSSRTCRKPAWFPCRATGADMEQHLKAAGRVKRTHAQGKTPGNLGSHPRCLHVRYCVTSRAA
jgi:hypothetical protein